MRKRRPLHERLRWKGEVSGPGEVPLVTRRRCPVGRRAFAFFRKKMWRIKVVVIGGGKRESRILLDCRGRSYERTRALCWRERKGGGGLFSTGGGPGNHELLELPSLHEKIGSFRRQRRKRGLSLLIEEREEGGPLLCSEWGERVYTVRIFRAS